MTDPVPPSLDALAPPEMARRAEALGEAKATMPAHRTLALAVLAGGFIGLGANLANIVATGTSDVPWGWARLVTGLSFSLGLGLVVVGGAELFTGNNLLVLAWASGRISAGRVLRNWGLVLVGNTVGATGLAVLVLLSGQYRFGQGAVGRTMLDLAAAKLALPFGQALVLGALCNVLVCLAVWLSMSARSSVDRLVCVALPVAAFVAAGFEHSIANLYIFPLAGLIQALAPSAFWESVGKSPADYEGIRLIPALWQLSAVTLGNVVGGAGLVGAMYWLIYLRPPSRP
jgi:formate/nitrite transporter